MYENLFKHQEEIFKVIANQKRLEIIQLLTHGELSVSAMVTMLGISQSNVSQHLSLLRQAGVVTTRKDGKSVYYRLKDKRIAEACMLIRQFLSDEHVIPEQTILEESTAKVYPLAVDLVCGMRVVTSEAESVVYNNKPYYFCAAGCKNKFKAHPRQYAKILANKT